jgi:serine/threonine protein kinase
MNTTQKDRKPQKMVGDYVLLQTVLGKGQFGEVVLAHHKDEPDKLLACKIIKKNNLSHRMQVNLKNEIGILARIKS